MSDTEPTKEALAAAEEIRESLIVQEEGLEYVSLPETPAPIARLIDLHACLPELLRVAEAAEDCIGFGDDGAVFQPDYKYAPALAQALAALRRAQESTR